MKNVSIGVLKQDRNFGLDISDSKYYDYEIHTCISELLLSLVLSYR